MAEMRVSEPSKLHLKKELTQIRKASRLLRDPGTTSSWKSPLASSRSAIAAVVTAPSLLPQASISPSSLSKNDFDSDKKKPVFLYNWKNLKSSSEKTASAAAAATSDSPLNPDDGSSSSTAPGLGSHRDDVSSSDTRNGDGDGEDGDASSSMIYTSTKRPPVFKKKKSKKATTTTAHLDILSRYHKKQKEPILGRNIVNTRRLLEVNHHHPPSIGDSFDQSDDTMEDYSYPGASPLLLKKLNRHTNNRLRNARKEDDSSCSYSTPAMSTSSFNMYVTKPNPSSTIGSWDGTATSINDGDDEVDDPLDLPGRQGCGIPCYWSRRLTPKHRGSMCGSCYSPSFSDTLRRKGTGILCGSQKSMYPTNRRLSNKQRRFSSRSGQGVLPLLTNGGDGLDSRGAGSSLGTGRSDDELSTNYGELDLEALSRLDGRRWSTSCRSEVGLEIVALNGEGEGERERKGEGTPESSRSFSYKYRPTFFGELIGQNIIVQSLINSISRGRIAPVYLFQGPCGTGKTSAARIFAAALNCLAPQETKPCGYCRECADFALGKCKDLLEVDGTNKKGIDRVKYHLKKLSLMPSSAFSRYKVFVIDECHLLSSKIWLTFLRFLEEPPRQVVFVFITTDLDNIPRTVQSMCHKYIFNKIKDGDIVERLKKISSEENLEVELEALDLIAMHADGSLRDAVTMLEQLTLLGKTITTSLVNELVGVVSEEKLLELLALAMSSDTAETVKRARELMDSGVDPMVLMSQLASLIMDIIAGTYNIIDMKYYDSFLAGRSLSEAELARLKQALKLLSEAEKQLRVSSERSTWFTATLLQLGSMASPDLSQSKSGSSRRQSCKSTNDDLSTASREHTAHKSNPDAWKSRSPNSSCNLVNANHSHQGSLLSQMDGFNYNSKHLPSDDSTMVGNIIFRSKNLEKLRDIWAQCIERCHSKTLRQLLHSHGKLLSLSEVEGVLVAYISFEDRDIKSRAERFLSSITNSMEMLLRSNVEVRIILLPDGEASINGATLVKLPESLKQAVNGSTGNGFSNRSLLLDGTYQSLVEGETLTNSVKEKKQEIPMQRIESIIREQRLETAWLQAVERGEKGTPGSLSHLKPEKNQVLPQGSMYYEDQLESINSMGVSSRQWEDELNHELKVLKMNDGRPPLQKEHIGRKIDHCPISPSLLHGGTLTAISSKDNMGYESGSGRNGGCSAFLCWNSTKPPGRGKVRPTRPQKGRHCLLFSECARSWK